MKTDINGTSTLQAGENYERFYSRAVKRTLYQYEYRDGDKYFTCVKPTLEECREAKDRFLSRNN